MRLRRPWWRLSAGAALTVLALIVAPAIGPARARAAGPEAAARATPSRESPKSSGRAALPAVVLSGCDAAATFLKTLPGTTVDRPAGPVDDPHSNAKLQGCKVHARGTFAALKSTPSPDDRLGRWFEERGWKGNPDYDADGPDGTAFAYETDKVRCFVRIDWDGGDDSDPSIIPEDWFEAEFGCVATEAGGSSSLTGLGCGAIRN